MEHCHVLPSKLVIRITSFSNSQIERIEITLAWGFVPTIRLLTACPECGKLVYGNTAWAVEKNGENYILTR